MPDFCSGVDVFTANRTNFIDEMVLFSSFLIENTAFCVKCHFMGLINSVVGISSETAPEYFLD